MPAERRHHVGADLELPRVRCRARARPELVGVAAHPPGTGAAPSPLHPRGQPAPARVGSADGPTVAGAEQDRQAIRRQRTVQATPGVVVTLASATGGGRPGTRCLRSPFNDLGTMNLAKEHRRGAPRPCETGDGSRPRHTAGRGPWPHAVRGSGESKGAADAAAGACSSGPHGRSGASQSGRQPITRHPGRPRGACFSKASSAMQLSNTRITFGTWSVRQSKRWALKICGTSVQSARVGVSPWQNVAGAPASCRSTTSSPSRPSAGTSGSCRLRRPSGVHQVAQHPQVVQRVDLAGDVVAPAPAPGPPEGVGGQQRRLGWVSSRYSMMASDCVTTWLAIRSSGTSRDADTLA
jgi:hypothetical protein